MISTLRCMSLLTIRRLSMCTQHRALLHLLRYTHWRRQIRWQTLQIGKPRICWTTPWRMGCAARSPAWGLMESLVLHGLVVTWTASTAVPHGRPPAKRRSLLWANVVAMRALGSTAISMWDDVGCTLVVLQIPQRSQACLVLDTAIRT